MALTYAQMDVHARQTFLPGLIDNVFLGHPFLTKVASRMQVIIEGGKSIVQPILYGKTNSGSYTGLERFNINPVETRTLAEWNWKQRYANITLVGTDLNTAGGDKQLLDLLSAEVENAEMTIRDDLAYDLVGDGTGNDSKDFDGLDNGIGTGTYGGISPSDISTWQSTVNTSAGAISIPRVEGWIGDVTYGPEKPDLILTTQDLYDALWAQAQPSQRALATGTPLFEAGFSGIQIDQTQILVDRHCTSGVMFGINTKYWKMFIHPNENFKWTGNKELIDANGYVRQILLMGNFICIGRRYNFKSTGCTA